MSFYTLNNKTSKFLTNGLNGTMEYDFLESFKFELDYGYFNTKNYSNSNYQLLNSSLAFHQEKFAWTYKLYANNLFNFEYKQDSNFSRYLISDTKQFLMPRVVLFSLAYKL